MGTAAKGGALAVMLSVLCGPVLADTEWEKLSGPEIEAALNERTLKYATASQTFYKSGKTLYNAGHPSWGNWRVQGDEYCSQWPPNTGWDCYGFERSLSVSLEGVRLRFVSRSGHVIQAVYME